MSDHARNTNITKTLNNWNNAFKAFAAHNSIQYDRHVKQDGAEEIKNCLGGCGLASASFQALDKDLPIVVKLTLSNTGFMNPTQATKKRQAFTEALPPKCLQNVLVPTQISTFRDYVVVQRPSLPTSLTQRIKSYPQLLDSERRWYAYQLLQAVHVLHHNSLTHGNIRTTNCLLTSWGWLMLTDILNQKPFIIPCNSSSTLHRNAYFEWAPNKQIIPDQPCTIAPERFVDGMEDEIKLSLDPSQNTTKSSEISVAPAPVIPIEDAQRADVFSCGCVIAELFTGQHLFSLSTVLQFKEGKYYPDNIFEQMPHDISELVRAMIDLNPSNRKTIDECLTFEVNGMPIFPVFFGNLHQLISVSEESEFEMRVAALMADRSLGPLFSIHKPAPIAQVDDSQTITQEEPPTSLIDENASETSAELTRLIKESEVQNMLDDVYTPDESVPIPKQALIPSLERDNELQSLLNVIQKLEQREHRRMNEGSSTEPSQNPLVQLQIRPNRSPSDSRSINWPVMPVAAGSSCGLVCTCDACSVAMLRKENHSAAIDWMEWERQKSSLTLDDFSKRQTGQKPKDRPSVRQQSINYFNLAKRVPDRSPPITASQFLIVNSIQCVHCTHGELCCLGNEQTVSESIEILQHSKKPLGDVNLPPQHPEYIIYILVIRTLLVSMSNLQFQRYCLNMICALSGYLEDLALIRYVAPTLVYLISNTRSQTIYNLSLDVLCHVLSSIRRAVPGQIDFFIHSIFPYILPSPDHSPMRTLGDGSMSQSTLPRNNQLFPELSVRAQYVSWEGKREVPMCIDDERPSPNKPIFSTNYAALASHFSHIALASMRYASLYVDTVEYPLHMKELPEMILCCITILLRLNTTTRFVFLKSPQTQFILPEMADSDALLYIFKSLIELNEWPIRASLAPSLCTIAKYNPKAAPNIIEDLLPRFGDRFEPVEAVLQRNLAAMSDIAQLVTPTETNSILQFDPTSFVPKSESLISKLLLAVQDIVWFLIHPNAWIRNEAVLFISRTAAALNPIMCLVILQPSVLPFLDPVHGVTVQLNDPASISSSLVTPITRTAFKTVMDHLIEDFRSDPPPVCSFRVTLSPPPSTYILKTPPPSMSSRQKIEKQMREDRIEKSFRAAFGESCLDFLFTTSKPTCEPGVSSLNLDMAREQARDVLNADSQHRKPEGPPKMSSSVSQNDLILLYLFRDKLFNAALAYKDLPREATPFQNEGSALSGVPIVRPQLDISQFIAPAAVNNQSTAGSAAANTSALVSSSEWALKLRQVQYLSEHTKGITSLSMSPSTDKPLFLSCSSDGYARLWDLSQMKSGEEAQQSLFAYCMAPSYDKAGSEHRGFVPPPMDRDISPLLIGPYLPSDTGFTSRPSMLGVEAKRSDVVPVQYHTSLLPGGSMFCYGTSTISPQSPGVLSFVDLQTGVEVLKQLAMDTDTISESHVLNAQPYSLLLSTGVRRSIFASSSVYNGVSCVKSFMSNTSPLVVYANTNGYIHVVDPRIAETAWVVHIPAICGSVTSIDVEPSAFYFVVGTSMGRVSLVDLRYGIPLLQTQSDSHTAINDIIATVSTTPFPSLSMSQQHPSFSPNRLSALSGYPLVWAATGVNRAVALSPSEGLGVCGSVGADVSRSWMQASSISALPSHSKQNDTTLTPHNPVPEPSVRALVAPSGSNCLITAGSDKVIRHWNWTNDGKQVSCTRVTHRLANCTITNESTGTCNHILEHDNNLSSALIDDQSSMQGLSKQDLQQLEDEDWSNHKDCITSMILVNDKLVSGSRDGSIIVWGSD
ncbi:putative Phosphoinositide 3-kinase regulatory subunit 4 [Blattamonas nauphoetae]|uniref:non-specific serine/threonine protein kinase n=1 Tax=Blattamonas nauphoetae TaxID=2049346 RepID=A0ABQ9YHU6_9EUKA|nr:putative Phosphoinositide 3-kinase regulatory subunit 4 [Blattamonas nauphoetae]